MVQIVEVMVAMVISAMMATAIATLTLSPIKTQRHKDIYSAVEAAAIGVRQYVVKNPTTFSDDSDITTANLGGPMATIGSNVADEFSRSTGSSTIAIDCILLPVPASPSLPRLVECRAPRDTDPSGQRITARQPLYTRSSLDPRSTLDACLSILATSGAGFESTPSSPIESIDLSSISGCETIGNLSFTPDPPTWSSTRYPCKLEFISGSTPPIKVTFEPSC
jgi:type II secretory pathway pseudopilin PulG